MVKSFYTNIINPNLGTDSPSSNVTNPMSAILDMGGNSIINAAQATQSNAIPTLAQVQSLIGSGTWVGTATSALNMVGNGIDQADYVDFVNQDGDNSGTPLSIQARIINSKPVLTIETENDTQQGIIYDSFFNPPSGNLDNLTIVDGNLEYKDEIVLTAQSGTNYIETLPNQVFYSPDSILLPYSAVPSVNATTFTLTGGMTFNSSTNSLVGSSATSTATSNFKFVNGSALSWSSVSGTGCNMGFYDVNADNPTQPFYSIGIINAGAGPQVQVQWTAVAGEEGTFYGDMISGLNTSLSIVYVNNSFQVFIGGVLAPDISSNGPNTDLPISFTDKLVLQAFFNAPAGVSITQPSMSLSNVYVPPPYQTRGLTLLQQTSNNKPNDANSYLFNLKIPLNQTSSAIPFNGDPSINTRLDIFILDSTNTSIIDNNPCWTFSFPSASPYMTWDTTSSFLTFLYQSDARNPINTASIVENFYLLPWTQRTLTGPYTYYYVLTLTNQAYLLSDSLSIFSECVVSNTTGNVYTYALCSEFTGTKTVVTVGNHNEKVLSFTASDNSIRYGDDVILTTANSSKYPMIPGLGLDPATSLLEFNNCQVMVNQFINQGSPTNFTSAITPNYSLSSSTTLVGTGIYTGSFQDLFSDVNNYTMYCSMSTSSPASQFPPYVSGDTISKTLMTVIIYDGSGNSIVPNQNYAGSPAFVFNNTGFTYSNGNLIFNMNVNPQSVPAGTDKYFLFSQPLNTSAVGPFTIKYFCLSYLASVGFAVVNSMNSCYFVDNEPDFSNPCPVASNTNGSGQITIRTAPTGPTIKCLPNGGGMNFFTDSLNFVPTASNGVPKVFNAVYFGTFNATPGMALNIPVYPYALDNFWYKWTIYITSISGASLGLTYTENGFGVPASTNTGILSFKTGSIINSFGVTNTSSLFTTTMISNFLSIAIATSNISTGFNWTLQVDIMSS